MVRRRRAVPQRDTRQRRRDVAAFARERVRVRDMSAVRKTIVRVFDQQRRAQGVALDASPGAQRVHLGLEPCGVLDLQVQRAPHFKQERFYPREACRDGSHDGED